MDLVTGAATAPDVDNSAKWRQTPVGLRTRRWGRLVVPGAAEPVAALDQIIERAGEALTLTRMADRDEQDLLLQAQSGLIREITDPKGLMSVRRWNALGLWGSLPLRVPSCYRSSSGSTGSPTPIRLECSCRSAV